MPKTIQVQPDEAGRRLDRLLSERLQVPRNQIQQWIRSDRVLLDGRPVKASHSVVSGEILECDPPVRDLARGIEPESGELEILHQDPDLVVIDKPAGLVVHPGAGRDHGTLVHRLLCPLPGDRRGRRTRSARHRPPARQGHQRPTGDRADSTRV